MPSTTPCSSRNSLQIRNTCGTVDGWTDGWRIVIVKTWYETSQVEIRGKQSHPDIYYDSLQSGCNFTIFYSVLCIVSKISFKSSDKDIPSYLLGLASPNKPQNLCKICFLDKKKKKSAEKWVLGTWFHEHPYCSDSNTWQKRLLNALNVNVM